MADQRCYLRVLLPIREIRLRFDNDRMRQQFIDNANHGIDIGLVTDDNGRQWRLRNAHIIGWTKETF